MPSPKNQRLVDLAPLAVGRRLPHHRRRGNLVRIEDFELDAILAISLDLMAANDVEQTGLNHPQNAGTEACLG